MKTKLLLALIGFAGLASLGRAAVVVVDPLCRREVVSVRSVCRVPAGRVVYAPSEACRPRYGHYERVVQVRRDGCREVRTVFVADGRGR